MAAFDFALSAVAIMGGTLVLTFVPYFLMRAWLAARSDHEARDLASSIVFRVAALHGLILALVFAQELVNYNAVQASIAREASQIEGVYFDLYRYDEEETQDIRLAIARYVHHVINVEWPRLGQGVGLEAEDWHWRNLIYDRLLDLEAKSGRQIWLRDNMIEEMANVALERNNRENAALTDVSIIFWIAAFAGIGLVTAPYFVFAPTFPNLVLLTVFGLYAGLILTFIGAIDGPFSGPGEIRPELLERLYDNYLRELIEAAPTLPQ